MPLSLPNLIRSRRPVGWVIAALLLLAGCRDSPELVLLNARDALAEVNKTSCGNKDRLNDALAELAKFVEPRAAGLINAAPEVEKTSSGQFKVFVTCKPPPSVLPAGEIVKVEETSDTTAVVKVKGKSAKSQVDVPMVLVQGRWKIDLLEMDSFAQAIKTR
jgi:hypothetical protein